MPIPSYGALPLAKTFILLRSLSLIAMITIVGLTANFVSLIISQDVSPPREIVGTLTITCLAALYTLISLPFFYAQANLGLLIMTATDFALLLAFTIISVLVGKPLSFLNCPAISSSSAASDASGAAAFAQAIASTGTSGATLSLRNLAASTKTNCYETKAIWGLCISLAILFFCSSVILPTLWMKAKRAGGGSGKSVV